MSRPENLFDDLHANLPEELFQTLLSTESFRIERIISRGHSSPANSWYDQPQSEWVLLLRGKARLQFEGREAIELSPGSFINIPPRVRHRVDWTDPGEPTVWLAIHYA